MAHPLGHPCFIAVPYQGTQNLCAKEMNKKIKYNYFAVIALMFPSLSECR